MILDSSYLFDLMANDSDAFDRGTELVKQGEMQWLPTPVVAEAYYGVATSRSETTLRKAGQSPISPRICIQLSDQSW